jgi:hypothetical protein
VPHERLQQVHDLLALDPEDGVGRLVVEELGVVERRLVGVLPALADRRICLSPFQLLILITRP